jgi:hypothetical protein
MVDMSSSSTVNNHTTATMTTSTYSIQPLKKQRQQQLHPLRNSGGNSVATTATTGSSSASRTVNDSVSTEFEQQQQQEEEGVLRDVLQELDKERTRRAELEAQIRQMQAEKLTLEQEIRQVARIQLKSSSNNAVVQAEEAEESSSLEISRRAFFAMEAQVQGYQQIVDALTLGKPAIAHAAAGEEKACSTSSLGLQSSSFKNQSPRRKNHRLLRHQAAASIKAAASSSLSSSTIASTTVLSSSLSSTGTSSLFNNINLDTRPTLPLHVVRLLEVMPWDARAQVYVFGKEELLEWQVWNEREQSWSSTSSNIKHFPRLFQTLPIATGTKAVTASTNNSYTDESSSSSYHTSSNGRGEQRNLLVFLAGAGEKPVHLPTKHGVLTNAGMNYILNIEAGYPLPQDGGVWEWVGGWRIEKRVTASRTGDDATIDTTSPPQQQQSGADGIMPVVVSNHRHSNQDGNSSNNQSNSGKKVRNKVDCDENGWSYAADATHFQTHPTELVWDNPGGNFGHEAITTNGIVVERRIRRRKWSRQRVLVDYPHASEATKQYLKLLAENARLNMTANKVSDQLVETKLSLTETEEKLESTRTEMAQQMALLQQEIREKTQLLQEASFLPSNTTTTTLSSSSSSSSSHTSNALQELFNKSEHGKQQLGSKFSQWIHGSSSGRRNSDDGSTASNNSAEENPLHSGSAHSAASANDATASTEVLAAVSRPQEAAATESSSTSCTGSGGSSSGVFDWRKVGPGTLLDKFKPAASNNKKDNENSSTATTTMSS